MSLKVKCPRCKKELDWETSESRPFCSERCRLQDLGAWFMEEHLISDEENSSLEALEQLQNIHKKIN